jgi:hypothetical protein
MDIYFKFKMITEFIIPIIFFVITFLIIVIVGIVSGSKENRIEKFFLTHGYKRKLFDVASVGDGAFYGWVRESDGKRVDDRDIRGWSLKQIKEKYK